VIGKLRADFVNVWLLAKDLEAIATRANDSDVAELCKQIRAHYAYPVDTVLFAPDRTVLGHLNAHEAAARDPRAYLAFLQRGLAAARGTPEPAAPAWRPAPPAGGRDTRPLVVTPQAPTVTVLDVVRRAALGEPGLKFFSIDATAFANGGTVELHVRVGTGTAAGAFELCAPMAGGMAPVRSTDKVAPGATATVTYEFAAGTRLGLAAKAGPGGAAGDTNAFLATITVRPR
jgi:hypothetical protein